MRYVFSQSTQHRCRSNYWYFRYQNEKQRSTPQYLRDSFRWPLFVCSFYFWVYININCKKCEFMQMQKLSLGPNCFRFRLISHQVQGDGGELGFGPLVANNHKYHNILISPCKHKHISLRICLPTHQHSFLAGHLQRKTFVCIFIQKPSLVLAVTLTNYSQTLIQESRPFSRALLSAVAVKIPMI